MRVRTPPGDFQVYAIAGTHTILIALNCDESKCKGLLGFAFRRERVGTNDKRPKWLRSLKVFKSVIPDPLSEKDPNDPSKQRRFSTWEHPIQSFLWADYTARPNERYQFAVVPMYGAPGDLKPAKAIKFEIRTEREFHQGHGVWFNRGAVASQAFAREFDNTGPTPPDNPNPKHKTTKWLSRGLLEACLSFINETPAGSGLRVAAYEFTYLPVLQALKDALDRGVDLRIVYHDTRTAGIDGANEKTIKKSKIPKSAGGRKVLFPRAKTKIPHNKFIIRLNAGSEPTAVWTGSTNFTPSGFLGQTNVGHAIEDAGVAEQFLAYWNLLKKDPERADARATVMSLTPNPPALVPPNSITAVFSPRPRSDLLKWYASRVDEAATSVMFTAAFGVAKQLVPAFVEDRDHLRFILMEKPPTEVLKKEFRKDRDLIISYGSVLGEMYRFKNGKPVARKKIEEFELDKWFLKEDHFRTRGFVFFVHTKFLLVDPLSDDPLICSGSANFSSNSLLQNDENMLLIRGDTRVADIYLTEFDRIFRHFYFRRIANEIEASGGTAQGAFLSEDDSWTKSYFTPKGFKSRRRQMFFTDTAQSWVGNALEP